MDVIYIDSLFLLNFIINYLILLATAKICGVGFRRLRYALAAALGAAYAVLVAFPVPGFLAAAPMKLSLGGFMSLISFGGEPRIIRKTLSFFAVSAAFGGIVFAASMLGGTSLSGGVFVPVSMRVLILSFAAAYAVLTVVFNRLGRRADRVVHEIEAQLQGRSARFRALADTGNELFDPISGSGVMIVELESAIELFSPEQRLVLRDGKLTQIEMLMRLGAGMRLVPYTAVGVERSLLLAVRPDALRVDGLPRSGVMIALSPTKICESGEYSAVL